MSHIGHDIRRAREEKKLSVDDVAKETKISPTVIRDIENGQFISYQGDEPYVRMYIKKISEVLGIDGYELTQQYNDLSSEIKKEIEDKQTEAPKTVSKQVNFEKPNYARNPSVYEDRSHITLIRFVIIVALIFAVVGIVWYAIASTSKDPTNFTDPNSTVIEGDVDINKDETDTNNQSGDKTDENINVTSVTINKVADFDYSIKIDDKEETFVLRMEFVNDSWTSIFKDRVHGTVLDGFETRVYGPKTKAVIDANAEKIKKHNEDNPHYIIEQKEDMEVVELTLNKADITDLYLRTGYSKGQHYYINGTEIELSDNEQVEGVSNLHILLEKES